MTLLLNKKLKAIVKESVKAYKEDLLLDLQVLLDKNKVSNTFIFCTRESGTCMYEKEKLYVKESTVRQDFDYFCKGFLEVYEITVEKRARKNVYGTIEEIDLTALLEDIDLNERSCKHAEVKIIKKDGSENNYIFSMEEEYSESLSKNNVIYDDIKKCHYLRYF